MHCGKETRVMVATEAANLAFAKRPWGAGNENVNLTRIWHGCNSPILNRRIAVLKCDRLAWTRMEVCYAVAVHRKFKLFGQASELIAKESGRAEGDDVIIGKLLPGKLTASCH